MKKSLGEFSNAQQKKHLLERVKCVRSFQFVHRAANSVAVPAEVKRARRIVNAYADRVSKTVNRARDKFDKARSKVEEQILFGTPEQALKAVEQFEKLFGRE